MFCPYTHIHTHTSRWLVAMCLSLVWHIPLFFWAQNPKIHFSVASLHFVFLPSDAHHLGGQPGMLFLSNWLARDYIYNSHSKQKIWDNHTCREEISWPQTFLYHVTSRSPLTRGLLFPPLSCLERAQELSHQMEIQVTSHWLASMWSLVPLPSLHEVRSVPRLPGHSHYFTLLVELV